MRSNNKNKLQATFQYFYQVLILAMQYYLRCYWKNRNLQQMEDYIIIDSVLQAAHMSKFVHKPKHLKKYEINSATCYLPVANFTIATDNMISPTCRNSSTPEGRTVRGELFMTTPPEHNKTKMKYILENNEKLSKNKPSAEGQKSFDEFFIKKELRNKTARQHSCRNVRIHRNHDVKQTIFYDASLKLTKKKSRQCVIFPETKFADRSSRNSTDKRQQRIQNNVNILELVQKQWQEAQKKRKIKTKSSSFGSREKAKFIKETKQIQQQLKNKENQEKTNRINVVTERSKQRKNYLYDSFNQSIMPLSRDEMRNKTSAILSKYGVDSYKCNLKVSPN